MRVYFTLSSYSVTWPPFRRKCLFLRSSSSQYSISGKVSRHCTPRVSRTNPSARRASRYDASGLYCANPTAAVACKTLPLTLHRLLYSGNSSLLQVC